MRTHFFVLFYYKSLLIIKMLNIKQYIQEITCCIVKNVYRIVLVQIYFKLNIS